MEIISVKFVKSSNDLKSCPSEGPPEYAFAGRSNVGKSSLLNYLANVKNLAKTSSTPGKTRLINHYLVNDSWYLVDLPGYGYARTGRKTRDTFFSAVDDFLLHRNTLACLFVLIDCRHNPLDSDLEFINKTGAAGIPLALIFTKTDKLSSTAVKRNIELYRKTLLQTWEELPVIFQTSSMEHTGRDQILAYIGKGNDSFNKNK
jgi:GTP-binding protein